MPALLATLLVAGLPGALAQDSAPSAAIAIVESPESLGPLEINGTSTVTVKVQLTASNFGCTEAASFPATVTAAAGAGSPSGVMVDPASQEIAFAVNQGLYTDSVPVAPPYSGVADASFTVTNAAALDNATFPVTLTAAFPGGLPASCQAAAGMPGAESAPAEVQVSVLAPEPEPEPEPILEDKSFLPGIQVLGALVAFVVAAAGRRRSDR